MIASARWAGSPWVLAGLVLLAAAFRMHHIDALELWHDEANSMFEANGLNYVGNAPEQGFTKADLPAFNTAANAIRACVFIDSGNGSLYVLLLHCWSLLFGNTPLALRSLSVLFALLAIFMTYRLSRELFRDDLAALISAALMAASPICIGQSQQVRSYMLALFLSLWATTLLFRMLRSERPGTWTILAYAALVLASMLSHYSTCYVFLVHPIIASILGTPLKSILRIISGGLLALVLFMVWMVAAGGEGLEQMRLYNEYYVDQVNINPFTGSFFTATDLRTIAEGWARQLLWVIGNSGQFLGARLRVLALLLLIPGALLVASIVRAKEIADRRILLSLCILLFSSMCYATALAVISGHTVSFQPHYVVFAAPYGALLLGAAIAQLRSGSGMLGNAKVVVVVAFFAGQLLMEFTVRTSRAIEPNNYSAYREHLRLAIERYGQDKIMAVHSSRSAAYQCALFAGPEANSLQHFVDPAYPQISGLIVERGNARWSVVLRPRNPRYHRSVPMDDHTWKLDYGAAASLPDSSDAWQPVALGMATVPAP